MSHDALTGSYPAASSDRDRFVVDRRGRRPSHDPWHYQGLIVEDERTPTGALARMATVLLTGRECPWRCAMCDLWTYTTAEDTPASAIPAQLSAARTVLGREPVAVSGMKLYNAGSFFDPRAVPEADYDAIALALGGLARIVVESHPALVGPRVDRLLAAFERHRGGGEPPQLELAMGLETAHPSALERLNKRFTLQRFAEAARMLDDRGVSLRVFLLIAPPFVPHAEQDAWLARSVDAAFDCGAAVVSLVPTRTGNGTLESLTANDFTSPDLSDVERSLALALTQAHGRGRVFADLWDLHRFARCPQCLEARSRRLEAMNHAQRLLDPCRCTACGHGVH